MPVNEKEKSMKLTKELNQFLPEDKKDELEKILAFWEKIKERWEEKKKEFWKNHNIDDFVKLLRYERKMSSEYDEVLWKMSGIEREKFIEEYLHDDILYSKLTWKEEIKNRENYWYEDLKKWWIILGENDQLNLRSKNIWAEWAEAISKMVLKKCVKLFLWGNSIWDEWAEAISKMVLKEWVWLDLFSNNIWDDWAKAISKMKLKEWVKLDLFGNQIWDEWAKAISKMELKDWV